MLGLHGSSITYRCTTQFYCFPSHIFIKNMKSNQDPPVITSVLYTASSMVSSVVLRNDQFKLHACMLHEFAVNCFAIVKVLIQAIIFTVSLFNIQ